MLVIRLSRKGRHSHPMYRLTVAENSMPTDGKFVEVVGNYNPTDLNQPLVIQKDRVEYWISKGAQPTETVAKLLNKQGFNIEVKQYHKAPKKVAKPETEKAMPVVVPVAEAEAPGTPAEEAPAEVVVEEVASPEVAAAEEAAPIEEVPVEAVVEEVASEAPITEESKE